MIGILLITHGTLGESLIHCASHVLNKRPPRVQQLGITAQDDPHLLPRDHRTERIQRRRNVHGRAGGCMPPPGSHRIVVPRATYRNVRDTAK